MISVFDHNLQRASAVITVPMFFGSMSILEGRPDEAIPRIKNVRTIFVFILLQDPGLSRLSCDGSPTSRH